MSVVPFSGLAASAPPIIPCYSSRDTGLPPLACGLVSLSSEKLSDSGAQADCQSGLSPCCCLLVAIFKAPLNCL